MTPDFLCALTVLALTLGASACAAFAVRMQARKRARMVAADGGELLIVPPPDAVPHFDHREVWK